MTEESVCNFSPLESTGEAPINFISAGILPLDSAWSEINVARDGRMFDNRDAGCVLSMAGMLKCKLFSLLKVSCCHFSGNRRIEPDCSCLSFKERNSGMASGMGFPSKMLP